MGSNNDEADENGAQIVGEIVGEIVVKTKKTLAKDEEFFENMDNKEKEFMRKNVKALDELEEMEVRCSACYEQVNHKLEGMISRHPILGVVICRPCKKFYLSGVWKRDEDGYFEHCRWCGNGGDLLCCSDDQCKNSFCKRCIKRNLGRTAVSDIQDNEAWKCLTCDKKQIRESRLLFYSIYKYWMSEKAKEEARVARKKAREASSHDSISQLLNEATSIQKVLKTSLDHQRIDWNKKRASLEGDDEEDEKKRAQFSAKAAQHLLKCIQLTQTSLKKLSSSVLQKVPSSSAASKLLKDLAKQVEELDTSVENMNDTSTSEVIRGSSNDITSAVEPLEETLEEVDKTIEEVDKKIEQVDKTIEAEKEIVNGNSVNEEETPMELEETEEEPKNDEKGEEENDQEVAKTPTKKKVSPSNKPGPRSSKPGYKPGPKSSKPGCQTPSKKEKFEEEPKVETNKKEKFEEEPKVETNGLDESKDIFDDSLKKEQEYEKIKQEVLKSSTDEEEDTTKKEKVSSSSNSNSPKKKLLTRRDRNKLKSKSPGDENSDKSLSDAEQDMEKASPKKKEKSKKVEEEEEVVTLETSDDENDLGLGTDSEVSEYEMEGDKDFKIEEEEAKKEKQRKSQPLSAEEKLKKRYNHLIDKIDKETDEKLNGKSNVEIQTLSAKVIKDLDEYEEVRVKDYDELNKLIRRNKRKSPKVQFDEEINRLCNLKSLEKRKSSKSKNSNSKSSKKSSKKNKNSDDEEEEDDDDDSLSETENLSSKKDKLLSANEMAKKAVLGSSSEDENDDDEDDSEGEGRKLRKKKKQQDKEESSTRKSERSNKGKRKENPSFMNTKLSETDSEDEEAGDRKSKRKNKKEKKDEENGLEDDDELSRGSKKKMKRKKIESDSDFEHEDAKEDSDEENEKDENGTDEEEEEDKNSDSDVPVKKKRGKRKKRNTSDSDSDASDDEDRPKKKKRKRIKNNSSSEGEKGSGGSDDENGSPSKGRKHIRKILSDKKVSSSTKEAATIERERRKRMEERQKTYNQSFEVKEGETIESLALDFDQETKEVFVEVNKKIVKKLKPHQAGGIRFMWDAVFETKKLVKEGKVPGGAILAHCMGLGKTLQTIGLIHTVHTRFPKQVATVLVLCPVNTIKNWVDEFDIWLKGDLEIDVFELTIEKDNWGRSDRLAMWKREGGVMVMGYDMFRNLTSEGKKFKKKQRECFQECLVDPGPDMVICDEGHVLKNLKSALNMAMNKIKTRRRIILTGTPLQNNLSEYFAMVNFVKPKLLGTFGEFKNRFVNPIQNGQHSDSTDRDVRVMKKRSFILNDLLKGCMQRLDYNVLVPYLQPKHEYVLCINLTDFQKKLYSFYLENYARAGQIGMDGKLEGGKKGGLFYDVQNLSRVWNHPYILKMAKTRADLKSMFEDDYEEEDLDEEGSLKNFIDDDDASEKSTSESGGESKDEDELIEEDIVPVKKTTRAKAKENDEKLVSGLDEVKEEALANSQGWWHQFLEDEQELDHIELGSKMILLMEILKECELLGDKVLVFSQSLLSLDLIEAFLEQIDKYGYDNKKDKETSAEKEKLDSYLGSWKNLRDYYRMDGSTPPDTRKKWCNFFNKSTNHQMRLFLISTKAGGLGINLCAANRVIIFDASWNPAHDVQSIFRVYRFGQTKPVYIYRFLAKGTMEEKIYDRQISKQSLSARVVDEHQIERHFSMNELAELYEFKDEPKENRPLPTVPKDRLLAEMLKKHENLIWKFHDHDSLLENQEGENLTEEERKAAWEEFENEKKGFVNMGNPMMNQAINSAINPQLIQDEYRRQYPHLTDEQVVHATRAFIMQIQSGIHRRPAYDKSHYQEEMARAKMQERSMYPHRFQGQLQSQLQGRLQGQLQGQNQMSQQFRQAQGMSTNMQYLAMQEQLKMANKQRETQQSDRLRNMMEEQRKLMANLQKSQRGGTSITMGAGGGRSGVSSGAVSASASNSNSRTGADDDEIQIEEIVLDGSPEFETITVDPPARSRPGIRRGRPRLDPDTDDYFGGGGQEQ